MSRKFSDRTGRTWLVERPHSRRELVFRPLEGSEHDEKVAPTPSHTDDPFELSDAELIRLLERARPRYRKPRRPPPF